MVIYILLISNNSKAIVIVAINIYYNSNMYVKVCNFTYIVKAYSFYP